MAVKCPECGIEFEPTTRQSWQIKNRPTHRLFCSMKCSLKARGIAAIGRKRKKCAACGKMFQLSKNQNRKVTLDSKRRVACSPECTNKIRNLKPITEPPKRLPKPVPPWIPYSGVGSSDFPALMNPF